MTEMLGVLAVIGVLSVGGISGYTAAMRKHRANEIVSQLNMMAHECSRFYTLQGQTGDCNVSGLDLSDVDGVTIARNMTKTAGQNFFSAALSGMNQALCETVKARLNNWAAAKVTTDPACNADSGNELVVQFKDDLSAWGSNGAGEETPQGPCAEYGEDETTCNKCNAGYYMAASGCEMCPGGTYSAAGATSCTDCEAGTNSESGSSACVSVEGECGYGAAVKASTWMSITNLLTDDGICDASCPTKCYARLANYGIYAINGFMGQYYCEGGQCYCNPPTNEPCKYGLYNSDRCVCICLVSGTLITLADGTKKKIEDIAYDDDLLVWDFDKGVFATAKPLWIKKKETTVQYDLITFSNGAVLKTINQHRIFNKEMGKFTYPMSEETPIGTTTFTDVGEEVTVVSKKTIQETVDYYNVITDYHMNCFANGILTSCRLSNLYPIEKMCYVRDNRVKVPYEGNFDSVPRKWYDGLRLGEQPQEVNRGNDIALDNSLLAYVERLIAIAKEK